MQAALFGRGVPMWGGPAKPAIAWPQPFPYETDTLRGESAGRGGGAGRAQHGAACSMPAPATIAEPMAVLVKESLAPLGINVELNKIPGANFRGELNKKTPRW